MTYCILNTVGHALTSLSTLFADHTKISISPILPIFGLKKPLKEIKNGRYIKLEI